MAVNIKLEDFEGPLDLLLHLIRQNKINILDIPIAEITNQYNQIINRWEFFDMEQACEYLEMATRLMNIKARMMLPREKAVLTEQEEDPREELIQQLETYAVFKDIAAYLEPFVSPNLLSYQKDPEYHPEFQIEKPANIRKQTLGRIVHRILLNQEIPDSTQMEIKPEKYFIKDKMETIMQILKRVNQTTLSKLFNGCHDIEEIITVFLAVLELYKIGSLIFDQRGQEIFVYGR